MNLTKYLISELDIFIPFVTTALFSNQPIILKTSYRKWSFTNMVVYQPNVKILIDFTHKISPIGTGLAYKETLGTTKRLDKNVFLITIHLKSHKGIENKDELLDTIAHELRHVYQFIFEGTSHKDIIHYEDNPTGYCESPIEIDANEFASKILVDYKGTKK